VKRARRKQEGKRKQEGTRKEAGGEEEAGGDEEGSRRGRGRKQEGTRKEAGREEEGGRRGRGRKQEGKRKEAGRKALRASLTSSQCPGVRSTSNGPPSTTITLNGIRKIKQISEPPDTKYY
jgi:hypothetical protein